MKKIFTLALVMAMAMTSFAQVKSSKVIKNMKAEQIQTYTGLESIESNFVASTRSMMTVPEEFELSQTFYDWQSNMGARNYTAVWPDGFAVMCYTQATNTSFSDRGTGLAIWDPAVGEWEYTDTRVEGVKTGFGSIARYGENGLVVAAHCASDARIFIVEDFRQGNRNFGEGIVLPVTTGVDPVWPAVQCSGENLDYVNILITNSGASTGVGDGADPIIYYQYHNGEWLHQYEMLPNLDSAHLADGGSNITYFMLYDEAKPNRVSFILNNAWSDCKLVISEDNGATWGERVFWQHPGIDLTYEDWFFYPRWTNAEFDANDNLHVVYEYNGTTGAAGAGSYYPAIGGVAYWSEILPKNALCQGGIGNVGEPFIMDTLYLVGDLYRSEWYWSDADHDPLPEYMGELEIVDDDGNVLPRDASEGNWPNNELWGEHGKYNNGKAGFATMHMDGDRIFAFWSMIAGNSESMYFDGTSHKFRLFGNMSNDGGQTWEGTQQILTDVMVMYGEMVYCQVIPYVYTDAEGDYLWLCYQYDEEAGTCVQDDETVWDNNFYHAVKVHINYFGVDENPMTVATTMNVYPNPAQGSFKVELNSAANVNIFNTVGQLVKTYNNVTEVNVNLESGIYFVNAGNQTMKVVVK
ncbi:MAG: T9SS type A sorting domain-containing protein [Bacteroidales bacterium]|nr:T9SS type A sorting domain-containing protein [Bacteroidales bacterium]